MQNYDMRDEGIDITLIEFPENTKRQDNGDVFSNYYQNEIAKEIRKNYEKSRI